MPHVFQFVLQETVKLPNSDYRIIRLLGKCISMMSYSLKATDKMGIVIYVITCNKNSWSLGVCYKCISVDFCIKDTLS